MPQGPDGVKNPLPPSKKPPSSEPPTAQADKAVWRRWARARRAELDLAATSAALAGPLGEWLDQLPPTTVLAYRAMVGELSLDAVVGADRRHRWATTRTPPSGPLTVHPWHSAMETHRFGFVQPVADAPIVSGDDIGVVLAPGLLFDRAGGRLGYGKGYYDVLFAGLDAIAVGVTAEALIVGRLATTPRDVPMDWLASDRGLWPCPVRL